jgi:sarcosine oxidase
VSTTYDVAVIGLGGMGSAAAWHLARRGQRVVGFEQFDPVHDRGSSHGSTRLVRQAYYEDPRYVPLLVRAYELWDELGSLTGSPALQRTGGLMLGPRDGAVVTGTLASAEQWGLPHRLLDADEVMRRHPAFRLRPDEVAVHEPAAGFVVPERTIADHLDLAAAAGAALHFRTDVQGWELTATGVRVHTGTAGFDAGRLVVCAGPWSTRVLADHGLPLVVERHLVHWFAPGGDPARFAADRLPGLADHWLSGTACMYTVTPDRNFVVGSVAGTDGRVTVAAGFSGHGFKFVPVIGEIVADLATHGSTALDISLFDPRRFDPAPVA